MMHLLIFGIIGKEMHAYSTNAPDRKHVPAIIAVVSVVAAIILNYFLKKLDVSFLWWLDAPSVMGFYVIFQWLFNKHLWGAGVGSMRLSSIPDIRGSWKGQITSSYGENETVVAALFVRQTWTEISIELETTNSRSTSKMAALNTPECSEQGLKYEFKNEPKTFAVETMQSFRGMAHLRLTPSGIALEGNYYTGRGRMNIGEISFSLISRELMSFEEVMKVP